MKVKKQGKVYIKNESVVITGFTVSGDETGKADLLCDYVINQIKRDVPFEIIFVDELPG